MAAVEAKKAVIEELQRQNDQLKREQELKKKDYVENPSGHRGI